MDRTASTVTLKTDVFGSTIEGMFSDFDAQITLDPDDLDGARIDAVVRTGSGVLNAPERQGDMDGHAGLDPQNHPEARFQSSSITRSGDVYTAQGLLTIKGVSQPATLVFTLHVKGQRAVARGGFTLARADFGVGKSGWGGAAAQVEIQLHIEADAGQ